MRYSRAAIFLVLGYVFFSISNAAVVHAQGAGLTIVPATIERAADPGEVITETVVVTNEGDEEKEYFLFKRNIKGVEGGGVPIFARDDLETTGYEITEWLSFESEKIVLPPHGKVSFPLTITVPQNASPGSHFGGIFVSAEPPRLREIGAGVGYEVASIISIRISGDIVDDARIRSFSSDKLIYGSKDVDFSTRIENQGNILIRPRGPLTIQSMWGGDPDVLIVNDNQAGVFPGAVRDFEFSWNDDGLGFGRYEAILALSYEGDKGQKTITASLYFWVLPANIIVPVIVGFLVIFLGGWLMTRFYVKRAVMRAGGGRRVVSARYRRQVGISRFAFVFVTLMGVVVLFLIVLLIFFA